MTKADSDFSLLGLDIATNPPKSVYKVIPEGPDRGKRAGIYYWRFDINSLCIAQKGLSLVALQKIWADEMALDEKRRLDWKCQRRKAVLVALTDKVWEIWSGDAKYRYARETFAADATKETLQQWLGLTVRHPSQPWFLTRELYWPTTVAAAVGTDQTWIGDTAAQLLTHLRKVEEYADRCNYWHKKRIETEVERSNRWNTHLCNTCHLCRGSLGGHGVVRFLSHMRDSHEEFWVDGSWMIGSSAQPRGPRGG